MDMDSEGFLLLTNGIIAFVVLGCYDNKCNIAH